MAHVAVFFEFLLNGLFIRRIFSRFASGGALSASVILSDHGVANRRFDTRFVILHTEGFAHGAVEHFGDRGIIHFGERQDENKECHQERRHIGKRRHPRGRPSLTLGALQGFFFLRRWRLFLLFLFLRLFVLFRFL